MSVLLTCVFYTYITKTTIMTCSGSTCAMVKSSGLEPHREAGGIRVVRASMYLPAYPTPTFSQD